jgi:hypothetical protein
MPLTMFRAKVKPGAMPDLADLAERTFAAIGEAGPSAVRYAAFRVVDGDEVVGLLDVEDRDDNPLSAVTEFVAWQQALPGFLAGPPQIDVLEPLGSYELV